MTPTRARLFPVLTLIVVCALCLGSLLSGCKSNNDDQEVRAVLESSLTIDDSDLSDITATLNKETVLDAYGVKLGDYVGTLLQGYSYNIDTIQVTDDTATASVTVTARNFSTAITAFKKSMDDHADSLKTLQQEKKTDELKQTVAGYLDAAFKGAGDATTSTAINVKLKKVDGAWVLTDQAGFTTDLNEAMFGTTVEKLKTALA